MATLSQIRAAIKTKIEGVADAGIVHDRERYAKNAADFMALFVTNGRLAGWTIRRFATAERRPAIGRYVVSHRWKITGYRGFDDANASETAFDLVIEEVRDAFRADDTLGGLIVTQKSADALDGPSGIQVESSLPVMFGTVLAHQAVLRLDTIAFL